MELGPFLMLASLEGAITAAVIALTAVGLSLVFGTMRVVNVAHGEFFMIGAVGAWWVVNLFVEHLGMSPALGFLAALIVAPALAASIAMIADNLILRRVNYDPERTIVATIGLLYVIQQGTLMTFGPHARPIEAPFNKRISLPWVEWGDNGLNVIWPWGLGTTTYKLFVVFAAIVVLVGLFQILKRSKYGLIMRATQQDRDMAQAFGIPVKKVYAVVFGLGAGMAALGAVLVLPIQQAHYLMGGDPLLLSFIVVIIGGLGSLGGTVVAAILIGMSDGIISVFFSATLAKIIATLLVAFVLILRPNGLFGKGAK